MGRRQDNGDNDVSLFPFLSILACIIGVLTLMISTLALSQMDTETVVAAEEFEKVESDLKAKTEELAKLQSQVDKANNRLSKHAGDKQKKLAELKKQVNETSSKFLLARQKAKSLDVKEPEEAVSVDQQPIDEIKQELTTYQEDIAQLKKEIEKRNLPPDEAEFSVLPGGSGRDMVPRFVECTATDLLIHTASEPVRVRAGAIETDATLLKLLNEVAGQPNAKVIFLVRDDGVHVYRRANRFVESLDVSAGKLPVLGQGKLNLQHFGIR